MKVLAALLLSLSIHTPQAVPPTLPVGAPHTQRQTARKGGKWYLAESGHAVYCYGPIKLVRQPNGDLQRVATFCEGQKFIVPLKD